MTSVNLAQPNCIDATLQHFRSAVAFRSTMAAFAAAHTRAPLAAHAPHRRHVPCVRVCAAAAAAPAAARIIDGKQIAQDIRGEIAAEVAALKKKTGKVCFHLFALV